MENKINVGEFDTLVTVRRKVILRGDRSQKTYVWEDHSKVWAKIVENVSEMIDNGNLEDGRSLEAYIYKIPGLDTRWQLIVRGKPYEIRSVDMISRISPVCVLSLFSIDG